MPYSFDFFKAYPALDASAQFKENPADFQVREVLGFEPEGKGEHLYLYVQKTNLSTQAMLEQLAKHLAIPLKHIGVSGLKDKRAVTWQWVSLPWPEKAPLPDIALENLQIEKMTRHTRKLKRGTHKHNHFVIRLQDVTVDEASLMARVALIKSQGVPNYFGFQRFGFDGQNVVRCEAAFTQHQKLSRAKKSLYLSAIRSYLFNRTLSLRVKDNNWHQAIAGDVFSLDGSKSFFEEPDLSQDTLRRVESKDIHPTGFLAGLADSPLTAQAKAYEETVFDAYPSLYSICQSQIQKTENRALRLCINDLTVVQEAPRRYCVSFSLPRGAYATAVLQEIVKVNGVLW